jgi:hypothetical protein
LTRPRSASPVCFFLTLLFSKSCSQLRAMLLVALSVLRSEGALLRVYGHHVVAPACPRIVFYFGFSDTAIWYMITGMGLFAWRVAPPRYLRNISLSTDCPGCSGYSQK